MIFYAEAGFWLGKRNHDKMAYFNHFQQNQYYSAIPYIMTLVSVPKVFFSRVWF